MSKALMTFLVAVLYGVSWIAGPLNLAAVVLTMADGRNPLTYVSVTLLTFGIILFVHRRMSWFPFRRSG
jgi:hypothetical protein